MSLILEALKKAEAERRVGQAPTLATVSPWATRRHRPWQGIALAVLLVATAGGVLWFALRGARAPDAAKPVASAMPASPATSAPRPEVAAPAGSAAPASAKASPTPPRAAATVPSSSERPAAARPAMPEPPADPAAPPATSRDLAVPGAEDLVRQRALVEATGARPPSGVAPGRRAEALDAPGSAKPVAPPSARDRDAVPPGVTLPPPPAHFTPKPGTETPEPVASPPGGRDDSLPQLSSANRAALPELKLTLHYFNADPARRFVLINGNRCSEGQNAAEGVRVREIRAEGVLLEFRGEPFFLPRAGG